MDLLLTETMIHQLCGETAYKKGEAYYRAKTVSLENYVEASSVFEANVRGNSSIFQVSIQKDGNGEIKAQCTCPSLASIDTYCQHIAAVLLSIQDLQRKELKLANEMLKLFDHRSKRSSANQLHFETRETLQVEFICRLIRQDEGQFIIGVHVKVGVTTLYSVLKLRNFLNQVKWRKPCVTSTHFTYNPELHSFQKETDAIISQLINIHHNEQIYLEQPNNQCLHIDSNTDESIITIPPSAWEDLFPLLSEAPLIKLEHDGNTFNGIRLSNEPIPLFFEFNKSSKSGYQLDVKGLHLITILEPYGYVLCEEKMIKLLADDCKRLADLKQMLDQSRTHQVIIASEQMEHFVETVIPGLMKLGHVQIAQAVSERLNITPFKAKLFLDRVKNRLLAGLEFHYGLMIVNPIEGNGQVGTTAPLVRHGEKEQEILEMMEHSQFTKTESGYFIHDEELEYNFLYHFLPRLEKLVKIYATTAVKIRLHTGSRSPMIRVDRDEQTDWLIFKFDIQGIPEAEIRKLLASLEEKRKYYKLANGSLLSLESKELQRFNKFMNEIDISSKDLDGEDIRIPLLRGIQHLDLLSDESITTMGQSLRKLMDNLQNPNHLEYTVPESLKSVLRDYQKFGFQWLKTLAKYRFGGILADDMGLGKTIQSIAYIVSVLPEIRKRKHPILIVCPSSLLYNWLNELNKFAPELNDLIVDGSKSERISKLKHISEVDVVVTSYPLLRADYKLYAKYPFHTMIMDEAQAFKNHTTQTAKAAKKIQADYRFALTGTPVENSIEEIWSIFNVVFPNLLPSRKEFMNLTPANVAKRVRPFLLRRLKEDVLMELPEKIESIQSSVLLPEQKKLYAAYLAKLKQETLKHLNKDTFKKNQIRILAGLTRLRQLCCHPALFVEGYKGSSAKFEQLMEIVADCRSSRKRLLIFSQFTSMLEIIRKELNHHNLPYFYLDGNTPSSERVALCNRFNNGERDLFLISLKAGGTGLNLTGADTVVLYDLWWNPAVEQQAADRAHRMGQKNVVHVIKLVAQGTIEDKMNELQEKKKNLINEIIKPSQETLSPLTEQDIKEILGIT